MRKILLGVSGASGMPLARRLMEMLAVSPGIDLCCIVSEGASRTLRHEFDEDESIFWALAKHAWKPSDLMAGPASGSWWKRDTAMAIVPCSMNTLGSLASGCCGNLLQRAADVGLKEGRKLVLIPREAPLSRIHLTNMLALKDAGAIIMPFSPGFYFRPQNIEDLLTHFCWRIMDQLEISHNGRRWGEQG